MVPVLFQHPSLVWCEQGWVLQFAMTATGGLRAALSSGDQQGTREYVAESSGDGAGGTGPIRESPFLEFLSHVNAGVRRRHALRL